MSINKSYVDGNGNLILQNVSASNISITNITDELKTFIEDIHRWNIESQERKGTLNIIVLATTIDKINSINQFLPLELTNYGNFPSDWKPYLDNKSIFELLQEYIEKSGFKIEAFFVDDINTTEIAIRSELNDILSSTILIVDGLALYSNKNEKFAKIFDNTQTGGCIVPVCKTHNEQVKTLITEKETEVFELLHYNYFNKFNRQFVNIELNIPTKEDFFRRLTNIAVKSINLPEPMKNAWVTDRLKQEGLINLKSGF